MSLFLVGYCIIDAIFLEDYMPVNNLLTINEYILYMVCMIVLIGIAGFTAFLAGTQFQTWLIKRSMIKMMDDMKNGSLNILLTNLKEDKEC